MTTTAPAELRPADWARMSWHQRRRYLARTGHPDRAAGLPTINHAEVDEFVALMHRAHGLARYRIRAVSGAWVVDGTRPDGRIIQVAIADTWDEAMRITTTLARYGSH